MFTGRWHTRCCDPPKKPNQSKSMKQVWTDTFLNACYHAIIMRNVNVLDETASEKTPFATICAEIVWKHQLAIGERDARTERERDRDRGRERSPACKWFPIQCLETTVNRRIILLSYWSIEYFPACPSACPPTFLTAWLSRCLLFVSGSFTTTKYCLSAWFVGPTYVLWWPLLVRSFVKYGAGGYTPVNNSDMSPPYGTDTGN